MTYADEIEFLRTQDLMEDFTDEELHAVHRLLRKKKIEYNKFIVAEDEVSTELYFIADGEVSILKWDEDQKHRLPLGRLQKGEMFGEMAFMDAEPRAASIKTTKDTEVWILSREDVDTHLKNFPDALNKLLVNIAKMNINRLRNSNVSYMTNLRAGLRKLQVRIDVGEFIISLFLMLLSVRLLGLWLSKQITIPYSETDWLFWGLAIIPTILLVRSFHLYADEIGLVFKNWKAVLKSSSLIILGGILAIWLFDAVYNPTQLKLFEIPPQQSGPFFPLFYLAYSCIVEFIGRGVILSSLQRFLSRESPWAPIIYSSLLIGLLQVFFDVKIGMLGFLASLFLGRIYVWQNSLLGVALIHFFIGLFGYYLNMV